MTTRTIACGLLVTGLCIWTADAQTVQVINMVPSSLSSETNQDSEPDITFNPNNPLEIVATAFTPNPAGTLTSAPVYISTDGGLTWVLNNIVPSANGMTGDITVTLSRNNTLYAGILRGGAGLDMRILRSTAYTGAVLMDELVARTSEDQPYARVHAALGGSQVDDDHLYVGHNDFNNLPKSASFEQSFDAATAAAPAGLSVFRLERRTPSGQDGPPIRPAIHPDGTVYAVYTQRTSSSGNDRTGNIVVVRDDDWGQGATAFSDITDPSDSVAGRFVVSGVTWVFNSASVFGQERLGDKATIAVDPRESQTVYVGWIDRPSGTGNNATVHVRSSTDGGATWPSERLTVTGAINPQLAVNIQGTVGVAYQQLTGAGATQRWETHFQQSTDGGVNWTDFTLATTLASSPTVSFLPYLGDYIGLVADGKDFLGVFAASNLPDNANFPNGITYQRSANFATNTLDDGAGGSVSVSIDPFFFRIRNREQDADYYVRDWTDSPTSNDIGLEPSTHAVFYHTSDVWNRRSNTAGGFDANDRPISEDPQESSLGNNFAFARVHRKAVGSSATVNLHFLKSEFGTGSNYQDANSTADPTLSFSATDSALTMTSGYEWTLTAVGSTHTCLAVEISTPDDPVVAPSLLGRAPGWPDTDLSVIYDNNKAQRNMGVYTESGIGGRLTLWALVRNAANIRRDMVLRVMPDDRFQKAFKRAELISVGGQASYRGDRIVFPGMNPCENRWVGLTIPVTGERADGERVLVTFAEQVGEIDVNGFTIAIDRQPVEIGGAESLRLLYSNLVRLGQESRNEEAASLAKTVREYLKGQSVAPGDYVKAVRAVYEPYRKLVGAAVRRSSGDPFELSSRFDVVREALPSGDAARVCPGQLDLDHAVEAFITFTEKQKGDLADVAQNMRWQAHLIGHNAKLNRVKGAAELAKLSAEFDRGYSSRALFAKDFPRYIERSLPVLERINEELVLGQRDALEEISKNSGNPRTLQMLHCAVLGAIEGATREDAAVAPLVVLGTVMAESRSSVPQVAASDQTFVVKIEKTLARNGAIADQAGQEITVVDPRRSLQVGKSYVLYVEPFLIGKSLAARLVRSEEGRQAEAVRPEKIQEMQQSEVLRQRLRQAELVVLGTVSAVRPVDQRNTPESEHFPDLRRATVKVDRVIKGVHRAEQVEFLFAASIDVHWYRAPKFKGGESGVFFLNTDAPQAESMKLDARVFTLFDPSDFQPRDRLGTIEALAR